MTMKRRILSILLAVLCVVMLSRDALIGYAAPTDPVEDFALNFYEGVKKGKPEYKFTIYEGKATDLCSKAMDRYPVLAHYYDSMNMLSYSDRTEITMQLKNLKDSPEDIPVVSSDQELFAVLGAALCRLQTTVDFIAADGYLPTTERVAKLATQLRHQYPLVYMGYGGWKGGGKHAGGSDENDYTLTLQWADGLSAATLKKWRQETEQAALRLSGTVFAQDMPDAEKILRIHDYLVNNNRYNTKNMDEPHNYLAYGSLVKGSCVCQGYADGCLVLCQAAGLEAVYVSGEGIGSDGSSEPHGWNAVKVDGEWYMVDTTWDDPVASTGEDILQYDYFLVTNKVLQKDHVWEQKNFPICTATTLNADKVRQRYENNQTQYKDYSNDRLITLAEAEAEFDALLQQYRSPLPGETTQTVPTQPTQTQPTVTQPTQTQPVSTAPEPTATQPATTAGNETNPTVPTNSIVPNPTNPTPGPGPGKKEPGGMLWMLFLLPVIAGIVIAVVLIVKSRNKPRRPTAPPRPPAPRSFDDLGKPPSASTRSFDDLGKPPKW